MDRAVVRVPVELLMRAAALALTCFGWRWAYFHGRCLARLGWLLMPRMRRIALRNVDLCFPDKPEAERTRVARESFKHNVYSFIDYLLVPRYFRPGKPNPYFHGTASDHPFFDWYKADEPGFNMTAHIGNFDVCSFNIGQDDNHQPLMLIVKPVRPPVLDRWLTRARERMGSEVVHAYEGARVYMRAIKERRKCGTIVDQNGGDFGPVESFFGVDCTWQADWIRLVTKRGVRLCYHACVRKGDRFSFQYLEPEFHDYGPEADPAEILRDYRDWVERVVGEYPEQYMWVHRRFKARRKDWWPRRYENLKQRLTPELRAELVKIPDGPKQRPGAPTGSGSNSA